MGLPVPQADGSPRLAPAPWRLRSADGMFWRRMRLVAMTERIPSDHFKPVRLVAEIVIAVVAGLVVVYIAREIGWDRPQDQPQEARTQPQPAPSPVPESQLVADPIPQPQTRQGRVPELDPVPIPQPVPTPDVQSQPDRNRVEPPRSPVRRESFLNLEFEIPAGWSKDEQISHGLGRRMLYLVPPGEPRPKESGDVESVAIVIDNNGGVNLVAVNERLYQQYKPDFDRFRQTLSRR